MAKAHITIGMAAAFTAAQPHTIPEALPIIVGASLGCLICDLDCESASERTDSSHWRIVMTVAAIAALIEDHLLNAGMWKSLADSGSYMWFAGLAGFALTCAFASVSRHRGFSHSIMALVLETAALWLIFPMAAGPFAIAFISHLALDIMNKRSVRLFYPAKTGVSLGWFYADRAANKACAMIGSVWLTVALMLCLING